MILTFGVVITFIAQIAGKASLLVIFRPSDQVMNFNMGKVDRCVHEYPIASWYWAEEAFCFALAIDNFVALFFLQRSFVEFMVMFQKP